MHSNYNAEKEEYLIGQCRTCKIGQKPIGPKSGCDIHKKLITDRNEVAWKHIHLFLDDKGKCRSWKPCAENTMKVELEDSQTLWKDVVDK